MGKCRFLDLCDHMQCHFPWSPAYFLMVLKNICNRDISLCHNTIESCEAAGGEEEMADLSVWRGNKNPCMDHPLPATDASAG